MNKILAIILLTLSVSACFNSERSETSINTTFGQELIDLKKAHDSGAINQGQYDKMLSRLADRRLKLDLTDEED